MSCKVNDINSYPKLNEVIRRAVGSNDKLYADLIGIAFDDNFAEYCKNSLGFELSLDGDMRKVFPAIKRYYNYIHPDINNTAINKKNVNIGGFSSVDAREFAKRHVGNLFNDFMSQANLLNVKEDFKLTKDNKTEVFNKYKAAVKARINKELSIRYKDIKDKNNSDALNNIIKKHADNNTPLSGVIEVINKYGTIQDKNLVALFNEVTNNYNEFLNEVFRDSRLASIKQEFNNDIKDLEDSDENDNDSNETDTVKQDNDDIDNYIGNLNQKLGTYNNFIQHVDGNLRNYFNSLKKLSSVEKINGEYSYDKSNDLGVTDTMDNDECCLVMFSYGDYSSVDNMIKSVRLISNNLDGFKAFAKFADDLSNNQDFANYVYTTFGKTIISKLETVLVDGVGTINKSNKGSDKKQQLVFEFMNNIKTSSIEIEDVNSKIVYAEIKKLLDLYNGKLKISKDSKDKDITELILSETNKLKINIKNKLFIKLHEYYPNISFGAISNYLSNNIVNGNVDFTVNAGILLNILDNTIKGGNTTLVNYNSRQAEINEVYRFNKALDNRKLEGEIIPFNQYKDINSLYNTNYLSNTSIKAVYDLANELENFEVVKVELNSRNAHQNLSSDVINNSLFTNIINTIKNDVALNNYGNYKFKGNQYDLSNILLEQKENDKIINYGLFRKENGKIIPTEYSKQLLSISLYNGGSDANGNKNATYSEMSKGDYVTSAFINFFSTENERVGKELISFGNYFSRIPSDAPKTFVIKAPKYSAKDLFVVSNLEEANKYINSKIEEIRNKIVNDEKYYNLSLNQVDENKFINHLTTNNQTIRLAIKEKLNEVNPKNGQLVTITYNYTNDNNESINYVIEGNYKKEGNKRFIENAKFVALLEDIYGDIVYLPNNIITKLRSVYEKEGIAEGVINQKINRDNVIFKQFKNIFKQELTNAAVAIDKFFEHDNGVISINEKGEPVFKEGFDNTDVTDRKVYEVYHRGKGKHILQKNKNGRYELTGKVFTTDRFEIYDRENNKLNNYLKDLIGENAAFDYFYGGLRNSLKINNVGKNIEVEFNEEQEAAVNEAIEKFILDYTKDAKERLIQYERFIPDYLKSDENYNEFILNNHLAYNGFNDLLEGDTKFYKDTQTFLKRSKESQGSGIPYGITNYEEPLDANRTVIQSELDSKNIEVYYNDNGTIKTRKVEQYNRFRGVTIKNTIRSSQAIDRLVQALINSGVDKDKAKKMMEGYNNTTVNDAQSYITYEEWIRRVAAKGELNKYKALIDRINDENTPINAKDLTEFVQVQKNFYYDQYYNEELNVETPRQIKNAEFVLVPRFIKGTDLERVYDIMMKHNIDQLNTAETSKAAQNNILTLWDNEGKMTDENIKDFIDNVDNSVELFNYNYLYKQQDTPQHMDASNKAGIQIMKKIIDNIDIDSPLWKNKDRLTRNYVANVKESFNDLMKEFNIELDKNGNIKLDKNGELPSLNNELFYESLLVEAGRLGLDSNMLDYLTLNKETAETIMPNYMSNVSTKLESIAQSLFNNRITRQKLPGFHAAQVTNVGFSLSAGKNNGGKESVGISKELKYHPEVNGKVQPYIEVMIPKPIQLSNLSDEEALNLMKDAGVDEFIGYRIPTEGKQSISIMKVVAFLDNTQGSTIIVPDDWVAQTGADFDIDSIYGITQEFYINKNNKISKQKYIEPKEENDYKLLYIRKINSLKLKGDLTANELLSVALETDNIEADFKQAEILANKNNSISYEDFKQTPVEDMQSRSARNNAIVDDMLDILRSPLSLEENLSRSNFDDIINARDKAIDENVQKRRKNRSPYNFLDQADFQEDVMSGAKLKAFSVTRDTFASVCNTVKPKFNEDNSVFVIYYAEDGYDYNTLIKRFGKDNIQIIKQNNKDCYVVKFDSLGWSADNKNIDNKLITAYGSQITAHTLDAVKEGAIPNVNDLTFGVYKTFPDVGADYLTGISFIMQPGVTRIVDAYNRNKSIYNKGANFNPIHTAIREIAIELGLPLNNFSGINQVIDELNKSYGEQIKGILGTFNKFTISLNQNNAGYAPFDRKRLINRLKEKTNDNNKVNHLLFDLGVILQYNRLSNTAKHISDLARVTNADKFGAKQSIYATNKVFDDINVILGDSRLNDILTVQVNDKKVNILEAIYPDVSKGLNEYIKSNNNESKYPSLNSFLKYSTATSIKINRSLFKTERVWFRNAINNIENYISGNMTEVLYKDVKNYILSNVYNNTNVIKNPISIHDGEIVLSNDENGIKEENARVYGYGKTPNIDFEVKDINFPTKEEVDNFSKLSPAQKAYWIKQNFNDSGVFKYINVNLFNEYQYKKNKSSQQTIKYADNAQNIETVLNEFDKTYFNENPLVKLAAIDIIKYAVIVEGFKMKRNGVTKIIKNNALYLDIKNGGTQFVNDSNEEINKLNSFDLNETYNNFIRSHSDIPQIKTYRNKKLNNNKYEINTFSNYNIINFNVINEDSLELALKSGFINYYDVNDGIITYEVPRYIKLVTNKKSTLYRVLADGTNVYAYPLNILEENENSKWSANVANNIYYAEEFYKEIIDEAISKNLNIEALTEEYKARTEEYKFVNTNKVDQTKFVQPFELTNPPKNHIGGFKAVIDHIDKTFNQIDSPVSTWIRSNALTSFMPIGSETIQNVNGYNYIIKRINLKESAKNYLKTGKLNKEIKELNADKKAIIERAREIGLTTLNDVFNIMPFNSSIDVETIDNGVRNSSITEDPIIELGNSSIYNMRRRGSVNKDIEATKALNNLKDKGITLNDNIAIKNNQDEVIRVTAAYIEQAVNTIKNNVLFFFTDSDGVNHSINDSATIDYIKKHPKEKDRFIKTILDASTFGSNYEIINTLDIDSQDSNIQPYLQKIKNNIDSLNNNIAINNARERFFLEYLNDASNNPLIKSDIINLLEGFHNVEWLESHISDIQETSMPLIQVVMKEVMADIRSKEFKAKQRVDEFINTLNEIKERASKNGNIINFDNIIDKNGRFVQNYSDQFITDLSNLRDEITKAKELFGKGSKEHIIAKYNYDKWKLQYTNQILLDDYYQRKLDIENNMITNYPTIYSEYKTLEEQRNEILSHIVNGELDESYKEQLDIVNDKIDGLTNPKISEYDLMTDEETVFNKSIAHNALKNYLENIKNLRAEYFDKDVKFAFEDQLDRNLRIIKSYEKRDNLGRLTTPINLLMEHNEYRKAKEWILNNAIYSVEGELNLELKKAFATLKEPSNIYVSLLNRLARKNEAYDSYGVINGNKFTKEEIANIKEEQANKYKINEHAAFSDTSLIKSSPVNDVVYKSSFYKAMTVDGTSNVDHLKIINEINKILSPYYDTATKSVETYNMTRDELIKLKELYTELDKSKGKDDSTNGKSVRTFIENNVDFVFDNNKYEIARRAAQLKGGAYYQTWLVTNTEEVVNKKTGITTSQPNHHIYGYIKPKAEVEHLYIDNEKTAAMRVIYNNVQFVPSEYYYDKMNNMDTNSDEFKEWYKDNHIYNPYTHVIEPLKIWSKMQVIGKSDEGKWLPRYNQLQSVPNESMINPNYKQNLSTAQNYKLHSGYDNITNMNEYEIEAKQLIYDILSSLASTDKAKKYIDEGYLPSKAKTKEHDFEYYIKEFAKSFGIINDANINPNWNENIDYASDYTVAMPMLQQLVDKNSQKLIPIPKRLENETQEEYENKIEKIKKDNEAIKENNAKIHKDLLDNNWEEVISEFILKASHYNAIQENKHLLFLGLQQLRNIKVYKTRLGNKSLLKDNKRSNDNDTVYHTKNPKFAEELYENSIRRILYDQFKKPQGKFTKAANILQNIASAKYMMFNVTGGIANVAYGSTQIFMERFAKEYFNHTDYETAKGLWIKSVPSFFANMYSDKSDNVIDGIIKFMNVVDFDRVGELQGDVTVDKYIERARNLAFSPQTIGEHYMQNTAMLAMMNSHRLYIKDGKTVINNLDSYKIECEKNALNSIINKSKELSDKFEDFIKNIKSDPNKTKDYATFKKYIVNDFVINNLTKEQQKEFIEKRKEFVDKAKEEFNKFPKLIDNFKLKDGKLTFKEDSKLTQLPKNESYKLLGEFKGKVISTNKKIHGVYDRLGAAKIESEWWGGLAMQYHKHLYPGFVKRYRNKGYFNEERQTIEKGSYNALLDFMSIPFKKFKADMNENEYTAMEGIQNLIKNVVNFATNFDLNYQLLPDNEKANLKRNLGDLLGVVSSLFLAMAIKLADDDDEGFIYNLCLYSADRLASESMAYTIPGAVLEAEKLWSSPIAASGGIKDLLSSLGVLSQIIIQGDEYNPYYTTGLYAKENKIGVMLRRQIPIYRSVERLVKLENNNKYYKLGDNILSIIPVNDIVEYIEK